MTIVPKMTFNNFGGRQGREEVRKWIELLRDLRRKNAKGRMRALARSLRGSFGFDVHYELNVMMLQFAGELNRPPSRLYNRIQKVAEVSQMFTV
jgi:hypothetical protein